MLKTILVSVICFILFSMLTVAQANVIEIETVFVENGQDYRFNVYAYLTESYSGFEIPLKAFSSDFVFDSASLFESILPGNYDLSWSISDDSTQMVLFVYPPFVLSDLIDPPGGKICEVYFHTRPLAISQTVLIDSADYDVYTPDSSILIVTYDLAGYDDEGLAKAVGFSAGFVDITISVGIEDDFQGVLPEQFQLYQNYPNPFNPVTTIGYAIPYDVHVRVELFDILGRKVKLLVDDYKSAGTHEVRVDGQNRSSGFYFYRIQAGKYTASRRMLLLK